ncbi:DEAD/DEAH box helicase [Micrococcales bacterium 31B]|nr:DEAD/DEAH box helicase [Micrococcales bacterium 31B]
MTPDLEGVLGALTARRARAECLRHVETVPPRDASFAAWPDWADPEVRQAFAGRGAIQMWSHQRAAADLAWEGRHVVLSTSTASGKSMAYQVPALTAIRARELGAKDDSGHLVPRSTALYISPTKALAGDQFASLQHLVDDNDLRGVRPAMYDGDTPTEMRRWVRTHANYVLTNPDMIHHVMLPGHQQWSSFLRALRFVIVDECHTYRGVFGSHIAMVLRRLRRLSRMYGGDATFVLTSATVAQPEVSAARLVGDEVFPITEDGSPRAGMKFALWEPEELMAFARVGRDPDPTVPSPTTEPSPTTGPATAGPADPSPAEPADFGLTGPESSPDLTGLTDPLVANASGAASLATHEQPQRRSVSAESADLMADLVVHGMRTLAFSRSRRGAEVVSRNTKRLLEAVARSAPDAAELPRRIAPYRAGYLPRERRELEARLRSGDLLGVAATNALELGIDISGLDAVIIGGWPGTRASLWQQAGRAGRGADHEALAIFVAREDPLDNYVVHHPESIFGQEVEAAVFDPENPYVMAPHLCAAASEMRIGNDEPEQFGETARELLDVLVERGALRRRASGWYWLLDEKAQDLADLRGSGGDIVRIVEAETGQLLGTIDAVSAQEQVHDGAVYLHQGATFVVQHLNIDDALATVVRRDPQHSTMSHSQSDIRVLRSDRSESWGDIEVHFGAVEVTDQVTGYQVTDILTGQIIGNHPLDYPQRTLHTKSVWFSIPHELVEARAGIDPVQLPGALHAAEHAAIGMLPLLATCDRWDIGGVSTAMHVDTENPTIFVYDGHAGGAGFSERGFMAARDWLLRTRETIALCECERGCPACVQSPKCGNGNEPLDKAAALRLLDAMLAEAPPSPGGQGGAVRAPRGAESLTSQAAPGGFGGPAPARVPVTDVGLPDGLDPAVVQSSVDDDPGW